MCEIRTHGKYVVGVYLECRSAFPSQPSHQSLPSKRTRTCIAGYNTHFQIWYQIKPGLRGHPTALEDACKDRCSQCDVERITRHTSRRDVACAVQHVMNQAATTTTVHRYSDLCGGYRGSTQDRADSIVLLCGYVYLRRCADQRYCGDPIAPNIFVS